MRLYDKYKLNENVDFIDVELTTDNKIWIDPMMMYMDKSPLGLKCCTIVQDYFSTLLEFAINKDDANGRLYTKNFVEMNETRLGYSFDKPRGNSGGESLGLEIYSLIRESKAIDTEFIGDIFDAGVMIQKLGIDKVSDFITSLIFEDLIIFTQDECKKYNIPMKNVTIKNYYWSAVEQRWIHNICVQLPFDEESNMAIVFVPKKFVEKKQVYSYGRFYNKAMLPYYGNEAVENRLYGLIRILKDKTIKPLYREIRKKNPCTRENVYQFIMNHRDIYDEYKRRQMSVINYKNYKNK